MFIGEAKMLQNSRHVKHKKIVHKNLPQYIDIQIMNLYTIFIYLFFFYEKKLT